MRISQYFKKRTDASVKLAIQNIAAKLDEEKIPRNKGIAKLSGADSKGIVAGTHWEFIEPLTKLPQSELLEQVLNNFMKK